MAWEGGVVAATDPGPGRGAAALLASAALALPIIAQEARAEAFDTTQIGLKFLDYRETGRMRARSPLLWFEAKPDDDSEVGGSVDLDTLSGASAQYVSNRTGSPVHTLSGASIRELRRSQEVHGRRAFGDASLGAALAHSRETDYRSRSLAADARFDFNARNTTLALGIGRTEDEIGKHGSERWYDRSTTDWLLGITQILSPRAIVQSNLTVGRGQGYFNDPYKFTMSFFGGSPVVQADRRPERRTHVAWLTRYRHFLPATDTALGIDYRYFTDDWGIRAHTLELSAAYAPTPGWRITPSLRYYTQGAADFFAQTFRTTGATGSSDARLGSFGALTLGFTLVHALTPTATLDIGAHWYRQRAAWRPGGGTADLPDLDARFVMVGFTQSF